MSESSSGGRDGETDPVEEADAIAPPSSSEVAPSLEEGASAAAATSAGESSSDASPSPAKPLMSYFDASDDEDEDDGGSPSSPDGSGDDAPSTPAAEGEAGASIAGTEDLAKQAAENDATTPEAPHEDGPPVQNQNENFSKMNGEAKFGDESTEGKPEEKSPRDKPTQQSDSVTEKEGEKNSAAEKDGDDDTKTTNKNNDEEKSPKSNEADEPDNAAPDDDSPGVAARNVSPDSLLEAERQAAIAAAVAANTPSTMSPSMAAGIAKVLALPGLMSDKVGEMSDKMGEMTDRAASTAGASMASITSMTGSMAGVVGGGASAAAGAGAGGGGSRQYPPPPPPRVANQYQSGPTIVALPPAPSPNGNDKSGVPPPGPPLKQRSHMRPVRFEDVKVAFAELLEKERRGEDSTAKEGRGAKTTKTKESAEAHATVVKSKVDELNASVGKEQNIARSVSVGEGEGAVKKLADESTDDAGEKAEEDSSAAAAVVQNIADDGTSRKNEEGISAEVDGDEGNESASSEDATPEIAVEEGAEEGDASSVIDESPDASPSETLAEKKKEDTEGDGETTSKNEDGSSSSQDEKDVEKTKGSATAEVGLSVTASLATKDLKAEKEPPAAPCTAIPDSYLRFLLLVARVPIIVEEHRPPVPPISPSSSASKDKAAKAAAVQEKIAKARETMQEPPPRKAPMVPKAATAAARRAYDILRMARTTYGRIERQRASLYDPTLSRDATSSFFAACAGENVGEHANEEESGEDGAAINAAAMNGGGDDILPSSLSSSSLLPTPPPPPTSLTAASSMASSVFSNVMSKMVAKKQGPFGDIGKKFMSASVGGQPQQGGQQQQRVAPVPSGEDNGGQAAGKQPTSSLGQNQHPMEDYEVMIDQEMLGLTVENVLERTIIRTLLPDGAARHAGAKVGSLIAKVGNMDTSNLTHFETIDELRQSQRPLKLTLRHIGKDVLRRAREEMGRLIRGRGLATSNLGEGDNGAKPAKPWREKDRSRKSFPTGETFDSVLTHRWPSSRRGGGSSLAMMGGGAGALGASAPPLVMTRAETMHQAGRDLIRILALLVVGLEKELSCWNENAELDGINKQHLSVKELNEAIEISSKILMDYARGHPDVDEKRPAPPPPKTQPFQAPAGSSFYPVPPGRVQGKKHGGPPPPGRGGPGRGRGGGKKARPDDTPLSRIGDALSRTRSFLVESSSATATTLRWEIIDYLCSVLDLDTEQELSERESVSSSAGGGDSAAAGPTNDLGSAGSILKLIVLNCSTSENSHANEEIAVHASNDDSESASSLDQSHDSSSLDQSSRSGGGDASRAGNPFLSVVHRLAASKSTSARVAACSLGPVLWSHLDFPRQLQLRGVITRALHDVEVAVRKSTATVLHEIAELVFDRRAVPWLVLMCERSMTDPEPQLRAAAMTLTWHLAEHLPNAFLGDASEGSRSLRRLPPRSSPTFMDVYLLQCKLLPVANNLSEDRVASVRLSVAAQCDRLCAALGEHWFSVIIDLLQALLSDADERVRGEAVLCMPRLVESVMLGTSESDGGGRGVTVLESLLPLALKIQKDSSPAVRSSLATATGELLIFLVGLGGGGGSGGGGGCNEPPPSPGRGGVASSDNENAAHKKHVDDTLIPILQRLLQDSDPEVTTASLRAVTNASRSGTRDTGSSTRIPACSHHTNANANLNTSIDDDLVSLSSHQSHQSHTSYDTRASVSRPVFIPVLSEEQVLRLLPTLSNLATSAQWRVRQSAVEIVPALMGCTRRHETRHEISKLCLRLMDDRVDAVRKTAAECLCLGGSSLARHGEDDGGEWIRKIVIPHLQTCSTSKDSKQRLLSLKMVEIIITNGLCPTTAMAVPTTPRASVAESEAASPGSCDTESTAATTTDGNATETPLRTILKIAASRASDEVANVRLNVGRTLGAILPLLLIESEGPRSEGDDVDFVVTTLEKQLEEETARPGGGDRDVLYFARQAVSMAPPSAVRRTSSTVST